LLGSRTALYGAALLAAGVLVSFEGMTGKTDAVLLGFTTWLSRETTQTTRFN